jgi:ABC-type branched-subunit amino acid transport system substrate-binding protein
MGSGISAYGEVFTPLKRVIPRLPRKRFHFVAYVPASVLIFVLLSGTSGAAMSASEERGKHIYVTGASPSGEPIMAYFGEKKLELPGEGATCGSCHGHDGTGRPESGLIPTNITWKYMTKSFGHIHANGLEHGRFTVKSLKEYLKSGVYPGGAQGDPSMPLYDMSDRDLDDLVAYMKRLGEILDPGLSQSVIRVGTLTPSNEPLTAIGDAIKNILSAYFSDINNQGGIYGRNMELVVHEVSGDQPQAMDLVEGWLAREKPFALVSTFTPDLDMDIQRVVSAEGIPLIGPFTLYPTENFNLNRHMFYLFSGLAVQVRTLIHYASERLDMMNPRVAIIHPEKKSLDQVIAAVKQACKGKGWQAVEQKLFPSENFDPTETVRQLQEEGSHVVIFLGIESQLRSFLTAGARRSWVPYVLAPGVLAGRTVVDAPREFRNRLYLAYPTLSRDRKDWAVKEFSGFMKAHDLRPSHPQAMISAYCAAKILVEAIRLSGRDLDRKKLTAVLEKFYQFKTGLTPPITYTPNRRMGANGAYVLGIHPEMGGQGGLPVFAEWVEVN